MRRRNDVLVGAVVLGAIALIIFGTIFLGGKVFGQEEREIQARFTEVGQVLKGNKVKLRGVEIGRVETVELADGGNGVIVTMTVRADVPLPEDPVVLLQTESFFGDWQAQIFPRARYPQYAYAEAPDPAVLPGYSMPDISQLTAVADDIAQNLKTISDRIEIAFTEETALNIRRVVENVQRASAQLNTMIDNQDRAIRDVAGNLRRTAESLEQTAITVQRTFAEVEGAIDGGQLSNIVNNVERTTLQADSLTRALRSMAADLQVAAAQADTTLRAVSSVATSIERGEGTMGMLMQDTTLYRTLVETNLELRTLLEDFRRNPTRYINLRVF